MARSSRLLFLLAVGVAAFGQNPDDKSASLQGIVTNSVTGEPVLRAHISLRPMQSGPQRSGQAPLKRYGALTTVEGKFSIAGMDPGRYQVALDKTGFVTATDAPPVVLQPGDKKDDLKLKLVPTGSISGRVLDAAGSPVEEAMVRVEMGPSFGTNTRTDDRGRFRIGGLTPGKYRVRATPQGIPVPPEIRTDGTKEAHYSATFYPGALLPRDATRVEARAGSDTAGIDIQLVRTPIVRVSGTVSGLPPGTQNVVVEVRSGPSSITGKSVKADGTFEFWRLDPGKYNLIANWSAPEGSRPGSGSAEIEVSDRNIDHVALNVLPPMDFSGQVECEDDQARPKQPRPRIVLVRPDNLMPVTADVDDSGAFHLTGLSPDRYRLGPGWWPAYVKSVRIGPTQIDGGVLDLRKGAPGNAITVVLSSAMASLTGTASNTHGPAAAAWVVILSEDWNNGRATYLVSTKADGTYSLGAIAPGKYKIVALDEADRSLVSTPDGLESLRDQMESLELNPNDKLTRDLKVIIP